MQPLGQRFGRFNQLAASLDTVDGALSEGLEKQVVNDETQVGLACTVVGQRWTLRGLGQFKQQLLDELEQVVHLLELAARVLVELALAREDVQLLEQLHRLAGAHLGGQAVGEGLLR